MYSQNILMLEYYTNYHCSIHLLITSMRLLFGKFSCINIYVVVLVDYHSLVQTFNMWKHKCLLNYVCAYIAAVCV